MSLLIMTFPSVLNKLPGVCFTQRLVTKICYKTSMFEVTHTHPTWHTHMAAFNCECIILCVSYGWNKWFDVCDSLVEEASVLILPERVGVSLTSL